MLCIFMQWYIAFVTNLNRECQSVKPNAERWMANLTSSTILQLFDHYIFMCIFRRKCFLIQNLLSMITLSKKDFHINSTKSIKSKFIEVIRNVYSSYSNFAYFLFSKNISYLLYFHSTSIKLNNVFFAQRLCTHKKLWFFALYANFCWWFNLLQSN